MAAGAEPYARLLALAERERELVRAGVGLEHELEPIARERAALVATLPARPPRAAAPLLERAVAVQAETSALLEAGVSAARRQLGRLEKGRGAVRGYTPPLPEATRLSRTG